MARRVMGWHIGRHVQTFWRVMWFRATQLVFTLYSRNRYSRNSLCLSVPLSHLTLALPLSLHSFPTPLPPQQVDCDGAHTDRIASAKRRQRVEFSRKYDLLRARWSILRLAINAICCLQIAVVVILSQIVNFKRLWKLSYLYIFSTYVSNSSCIWS